MASPFTENTSQAVLSASRANPGCVKHKVANLLYSLFERALSISYANVSGPIASLNYSINEICFRLEEKFKNW